MLAIVGASGKLGFATLNALLDHGLESPHRIVCTTSSASGAEKLENAKSKGVHVRHAAFDEPDSFDAALQGCTRLFLISSPRIEKDFHDAPPGEGREEDHLHVLRAAKRIGIEHVYYTSLAFAYPSKSRVMKAHERTEDWIATELAHYTVIREGLYNESWPLYLGHYGVGVDERSELAVAGDCKISWTSIRDLGLASAIILTSPTQDWDKKTFYLSQKKAHSLAEVASVVARVRGKQLETKLVARDEYERYYVEERGMKEPFIKWWSKTYDALNDGECEIDDPTLERLLGDRGISPTSMEVTVADMMRA